MKNVRVKLVWLSCYGQYTFSIYEGRKLLMQKAGANWLWSTKYAAIRNAKAMAKRIGIKYDSEIIKQHGC